MFLWRSLSPTVLLSVLTALARPERPEVEPEHQGSAGSAPVTRLADHKARAKA